MDDRGSGSSLSGLGTGSGAAASLSRRGESGRDDCCRGGDGDGGDALLNLHVVALIPGMSSELYERRLDLRR